jgi:hypothetical protein
LGINCTGNNAANDDNTAEGDLSAENAAMSIFVTKNKSNRKAKTLVIVNTQTANFAFFFDFFFVFKATGNLSTEKKNEQAIIATRDARLRRVSPIQTQMRWRESLHDMRALSQVVLVHDRAGKARPQAETQSSGSGCDSKRITNTNNLHCDFGSD